MVDALLFFDWMRLPDGIGFEFLLVKKKMSIQSLTCETMK